MSTDDCILVPGEEQLQGEPIQWSRQAAVELSLHLMAWPELDVPHWPGRPGLAQAEVHPRLPSLLRP